MKTIENLLKFSVFDDLIEGVQVIDSDFKYAYVNYSASNQIKKTREELIGKTITSVFPEIDSTDIYHKIQDCLENGQFADYLHDFIFEDGSTGYFELKMQKIKEGVLILSIDETQKITYQKQLEKEILKIKQIKLELRVSEKRYTDLFKLNPVPMFLFDLKTLKFLQVNKSAIANYGYTEEEFLKMTLLDIRPKSEQSTFIQSYNSNVAKDKSFYIEKTLHQSKENKKIIADVFQDNITINNKEYGLAIVVNVTEKSHFENEINKAIFQAQEDERNELGKELHDNVGQLLVTSMLNLNQLESETDVSSNHFFQQSLKMMNTTLKEVRNISHKLTPSLFEDFNLKDILFSLIHEINISNQFKLNIKIDEKFNIKTFDKLLSLNLYRMTQEILTNILKHADASKIDVELTWLNNFLILTISDDGKGFDAKICSKGIGLKNLYKRVELYYGSLNIESSIGNGCQTTIKIPFNS